jgi:hypothetical protein
MIAVDPTHPSYIVVGTNTNYDAPIGDLFPTGYFASSNGGRSFVEGVAPMVRPFTTGADPSTAIARDGTVFFDFLSETPSYCSGGRSAVILTHSIDHGRSFRPPVVVDINSADDKPFMTVESIPNRPSHVFVVWTRWHNAGSDIWFARSTDGGAHFSPPHMLYSSKLDNFGPMPVVGPRGRVSVFWATFPERSLTSVAPARILMRSSSNDGVHFGVQRHVSGWFTSLPRMVTPGSLRNLTGPGATSDGNGVLYASWAQVARQRAGGAVDADIVITRSTDGGAHWSRPVRVNDARGADRFMPSLTAWSDASVGVAFYDRRNGPGRLDVYASRVRFSGKLTASANVQVNQGASPTADIYYIAPGSTCLSPGRFFGDYIGAAAAPHHRLCVVWSSARSQFPGTTDIWFRSITF